MNTIRLRLSIMMFLQYFVWGSWGVAAGTYMVETLRFTGADASWIYNSTAIAAMISPLFVGYVADRFFSTEKILAFLHLVGGGLLLAAAEQPTFPRLMMVMVAYAICFMPTLALTNSISFHNIRDPEREFPAIRVWGTIGWIAAGLAVGTLLGEKNKAFFDMAGISSVLLAAYCLTLPHTPPRREEASGDLLGIGALSLLQEASFAIFVFCSFLICIPLAFYYTFANPFLTETDMPVPTALQTVGQISEIFFMAAMPFFIRRLGVKYMLLVGMLAWVARYWCFSTLEFNWVLLGLVLHGVCYDFFFVASQIYVDQRAPRHLRASAQSFIAFVTLGVGIFLGNLTAGYTVDRYPALQVSVSRPDGSPAGKALLPAWHSDEQYTGFWKYLDLSSTVRGWLFGESQSQRPPDFAEQNDKNKDGAIDISEIPDKWREQKQAEPSEDDLIYDGMSIRSVMHVLRHDKGAGVDRQEWRRVQSHKWRDIWYWPATMAAVTCLLFFLGFHDRPSRQTIEAMAEESVLGAGEGPEPQVG